jgi:hypothetical protein
LLKNVYQYYYNENIFKKKDFSLLLLYSSSRRMRWAGDVARMGEERIQGFGRKT